VPKKLGLLRRHKSIFLAQPFDVFTELLYRDGIDARRADLIWVPDIVAGRERK
jgi:hypothetical protein